MPRRPSQSPFRAFELDAAAPEALHRQLYDELRRAILSGRLAAHSRLPASRELAAVSQVSRNTVLSAYDQLLAEGYIVSRPGSGTFVADTIPEALEPACPEPKALPLPARAPRALSRRGEKVRSTRFSGRPLPTTANCFRLGLPALEHFPMDLWRRLLDRRMRRASVRLLAYSDAQGLPALREAIAAQLAASRGVRCDASNVVITNGAQQAISLCARLLLDAGDSMWMEDPGYFAARAVFESADADVVPVPVDREGLDVAAGIARAPRAKLAYVTPSHQNPTGVTLSLPRRMALLKWARETGSWIVEDDNASEYRYRGRPLAALQGIDADQRVIYLGSFSKVLFASLRVGYAVVPDDLVEPFRLAHQMYTRGTASISQAVIADFMAEGHFARHLRRMRTLYAGRLALLEDAVHHHAADVLEFQPIEGGLNRLVWLPPGMDDVAASDALAAADLIAAPLSAYALEPMPRGGLVLGFAGADEKEIEPSIVRMAGILRGLRRASANGK